MAKYLIEGAYTAAGLQGLAKESAKSREATVSKMIAAAGGKVEGLYWALGDSDVYLIAEMPDATTVAAVSMMVSASGAIRVKSVPLLTAAEVDQAIAKGVSVTARQEPARRRNESGSALSLFL